MQYFKDFYYAPVKLISKINQTYFILDCTFINEGEKFT